ncbi:MAG TPA: AsmA-like C-terminal region-containing protein, partial [Candidatus Binatia bacterium]|nr:AsmA-like C-terminal region-containing protein [Candidatus Binatia bacterium]
VEILLQSGSSGKPDIRLARTSHMRKSHKLLLFFLIASAAAVMAFIQTFNTLAAKNREQVHQELQRFLGKDATFDRLEASLWGGLGFSAKEFRIADDPRFAATPVIHAQELRLGVSLLPLLLGKIVINSLTFQAPEFQIITDERGLLNLAELAGQKNETKPLPRSQTSSPERKPLTVNFLVAKISVKNGRVDFIDRSIKEPAEIRVKNVEMEVKGLNPSEKTRIKFAAAVTEGLGHDVRIDGALGPLRQPHGWSQQPVELEIRFDSLSATLLARALPFLRNRIPRELDVTGPLSLQAKLGGTFNRPRITDIALKIPLFGSSNYNAIAEGSLEIPEGRPWAEAQLKGKLTLTSINLTQLRNLPFLKQTLPIALETEGSINAYSQFEGTWANLRVGALIKGEKSEFRYRDWFRKPAGSPAELKAKISRQKIGLVLHDSELSFGNSKMTLSGVVEEALQPRLQLKLRSDSSHLPTWWRLVSPLSFDGVGGTIGWDIVLRKNYASGDGWNIHGKLNLADAEFRHKQTGRKIDQLNAAIAFLGTEALLEKGSFRLGSSLITVAAKVTDLTQPSARYQLRSPEVHLMDLQTFLAGKTNQIRNVTASGEIRWQDDAPSLRGTLSSSEGNLEDIPYRELQADVTWSPKGISFKNLSLQAFDGVLRADGYWPAGVDPAQRFSLKSQSESIQLGSLLKQKFPQLKNRLEGQLNFRGQFDAATQNGATVTKSLQGSGESVIHHGTIRDFNLIAKIIPGGGGDSGSSRLPANLAALVDRPYTPFDTLKANFRVDGQRIRTDDLLLVTPDYTITGAGWVGFDRTTQWNGLLVFSPRITQELQREYKMIRYLLDRRGRLSISFRAEGRFPNVKVKPENRAVAQVLRRSFPQKADEPAAGDGKSTEKNERKTWLPESLEQLLKQ